GSYAVVGSQDRNAYVFTKNNNTPLWTYDVDSWVTAVAISADGKYVVVGGKNDAILLFDYDDNTPLWESSDLTQQVIDIVTSDDGKYIAVGTKATGQGKLFLFDKSSSSPLWSDNMGVVSSVAISSNGSRIATASEDYYIYLHSKTSADYLWKYQTGSKAKSVSISSDGTSIAAGSQDSKVYLFSSSTRIPLWSHNIGGGATSVKITSDGKYIVAGGMSETVYFFDRSSNIYVWKDILSEDIETISISNTASYMLVGSSKSDDTGKVRFLTSPYLKWSYINSTVPSLVAQYTNVTFSGYADSPSEVVSYFWRSDIDGLLSTEATFTTNQLSAGKHTITFQAKYNGSTSHTSTIGPHVDSNTINMWRLDEGSGSTTSDEGSYGWTGSLYNSPSWVTGKFGSALEFDGDNDYVQSTSSTSTNTGEVTIEAWIKLGGDVGSESVIYAWGTCPVQLRVTTSEKLKLNAYFNVGSRYLTGSTTLVPDVWYHVAATVSESGDTMKLYINGTEDASYSLGSSNTMDHWGGNDRIGYYSGYWGSDYFEGIIDEVRVSNFARTSFVFNITYTKYNWSHPSVVQIRLNAPPVISSMTVNPGVIQQYNSTGLQTTVDSHTLAYWRFEDGDGRTVTDETNWSWDGTTEYGPDWVTGRYGGGMEFGYDENWQYVELDNNYHRGEQFQNGFTFETWIYNSENSDTNREIIRINEPYFRVSWEGDNRISFYKYNNNDVGNYLYSSSTLEKNKWYHIAIVIDNDVSTKLYVNGVLDSQNSNGYIPRTDCCNNHKIGYFYGKLDEMRISTINRSPDEFLLTDRDNISFYSSATDAEGEIANYTWRSDIDGIISYQRLFSFNATIHLTPGYHNFTLNVTDNDGKVVTSSPVMVRVKTIPVVTIDSITPNAAPKGTSVSLAASATDNDGAIAAYQWYSDLDGLISTSEDFSTTGLSPGYHNITFRAQDVDGYWSFKDYEHVLVTGIKVTPDFGVQGSGFYDFDFSYKREITLSSATSIDNTTIEIVLDNSTFDYQYVHQTGRDIRFYDSTLSTKFHYWIEEWNYNGTSKIWIKIPDSGTSKFYLVYGNDAVISESNASNIFEFFDDFNDGSLDSTLWKGDTSKFTECNGYLYAGESCDSSGRNGYRLLSNEEWTGSYVMEVRVYIDYTNWGGFQAAGWHESTSNGIGVGFYSYEDNYAGWDDGNDWDYSLGSESYDNDWVTITLSGFSGEGNAIVSYYNEDDNTYYNHTIYNSGISGEEIALGEWQCDCWQNYTYRAWWDYILVRNYDSTTYTIQIGNHTSANTVNNNITFKTTVADTNSLISNYTWFSSKDGYIGNTSNFVVPSTSLSLGNHTISVRLKDSSGSWSGWSNFTYYVYKTPTVASMDISAWIDDQGDRVFFNGTGSDTDGMIVGYRWASSIDGIISTSASFNTATLSPGNHTIYFQVKDNSTLWSSKSDKWLYINDQPIATIVSVSPALVYTNGTFIPDKPE
ncbi:DUF2341 domain-containing protein, partial [Marine Group III euryarchaeote]|nr:DUF2341 domain-containing protein [Marine Group III euryarchaeote]